MLPSSLSRLVPIVSLVLQFLLGFVCFVFGTLKFVHLKETIVVQIHYQIVSTYFINKNALMCPVQPLRIGELCPVYLPMPPELARPYVESIRELLKSDVLNLCRPSYVALSRSLILHE